MTNDQDHKIWMLLTQTGDAMFKAREKELQRHGITAPEATVLFILQSIGDQATPAEVSRCMVQEAHSVWGLLDRMEKKGLVNRTKNLKPKNLVRVTVTEKGKEAYEMSTGYESTHNILSVLSPSAHIQLGSCLRALRNRALKEMHVEHELPFP